MDPDQDSDPDTDTDPAIFVIDLQDANKKLIFFKINSAFYFLKVHLHHFSKIKKKKKESQNSRNQGFSYYFCMTIEGSGSGRPKNMWIRWIRIRNTALKDTLTSFAVNSRRESIIH